MDCAPDPGKWPLRSLHWIVLVSTLLLKGCGQPTLLSTLQIRGVLGIDQDAWAAGAVGPDGSISADQLKPQLVTVGQEGELSHVRLPASNGRLDVPFFSGNPEDLCEGTKFFYKSGSLQDGKKDCSPKKKSTQQPIAPCQEDGKANCRATKDFPAIDISTIRAGQIRAGITIAGVQGTLQGAPVVCSKDGETGCLVAFSLQALDTSLIAPGHIRRGVSIAGISGTYPSEATPIEGSSQM
jgi:hypothetical protein